MVTLSSLAGISWLLPPPARVPLGMQGPLLPEPAELFATFSIGNLILSLLILAGAYLATQLAKRLSHYLERSRALGRGLVKYFPLLNLAVWLAAAWAVIGLNQAGLSRWITLLFLLAVAAIILGAHRLLQDLVGGVVLVLERPFHIGDRVKIEDREGVIGHIGLRSFQIVGPDLSVSTIPNAQILKNTVTNLSRGERQAQVVFDLPIPEDCNVSEAMRVAREAAVICPYTYLNKPVEVFLTPGSESGSAGTLTVRAYVFDSQYAQQLQTHVISLMRDGWGAAAD